MLKFLKYTLAASLLVGPVHVGAASAQVDLPGFDRLAVSAAHRPGLVAGSIWYPAGQVTYKTKWFTMRFLLASLLIGPLKLPRFANR